MASNLLLDLSDDNGAQSMSKNHQLENSKHESTEETCGTQIGSIEWKLSTMVELKDEMTMSNNNNNNNNNVLLGALDDNLSQEIGGSIIGLMKNEKK